MPKLISEAEDLVWNISYHNANEHWYYYRMTLHWKGLPVVNPAIRFLDNNDQPQDDFGICHDDGDGLRHIFDNALLTGRPYAWNSIEPASRFAIYPGLSWPFCDECFNEFFDSSNGIDDVLKKEESRKKEAFDSDGIWTFMFFVDTGSFKGDDFFYSGDGVILSLSTTRKEVKRFRRELEVEYEEFSKRIGYKEPESEDEKKINDAIKNGIILESGEKAIYDESIGVWRYKDIIIKL